LALTEVDIQASPLACSLHVFNPAYVKAMMDGWRGERWDGGEPLDDEHARWLTMESGAHAVAIAEGGRRPDGRRGFDAHLVTLVERRYVLDLTLHQVNRPHKNIVVEPHFFEVDSAFVRGGVPAIFDSNGCVMRYWVVHRNDFVVAPDWREVRRDEGLVRTSVTRIREALQT
jgi:hypothetical protein